MRCILKRKLLLLSTYILVAGLTLGCGQTTEPQEPPAAEETANPEQPDMSSPVNPTGGISPYYKEPNLDESDDDTNPEASPEADDTNPISASVYNESEPADTAGPTEDIKPAVTERVSRDVYVATYGSDLNDGTEEYPFRTIQKGLDSVTPGHTVFIKSGIYFGKNTFTNSGTEDGYITVAAMPLQNVVVTLGYGESGAIFDINGQSNILIRELRIGYSRSDWVYGVYMHGGEHNIIVTDNDICNLATYNRSGYGYGGAYGVLMYGQGPDEESAISNISIDNNRVYTIETGNCEAIAASGNCDNINISSNVVYDIMNIGIDLYGNADYCTNPALDQPRFCTVRDNTVYNCVRDNYAVAGIYVDGARDIEISGNVVYENMYGILVCSEHRDDNYPVTNIYIDNNEIHDNHDGGIAFGGYDTTLAGLVKDSEITNNRLYNNGQFANDGWNGEIDIEKCSNIIIRDNVVTAHDYRYPVIGSQASADFIHDVSFINNAYITGDPEKIRFQFAGANYRGLTAWNKAVNGTDTNTKEESK